MPFSRAALIVSIGLICGGVHAGVSHWYAAAATPGSWARVTEQQYQQRYGQAEPRPVIDLLIMGDSHAKCGIDPRLLDGAFNFATLGALYLHTYSRLKHLLEDEQQAVTRLLIPMDSHSLAWQRKRLHEADYWAQYFDYPKLAWRSGRWVYCAREFTRHRLTPYLGAGDDMAAYALGWNIASTPFPVHRGFIPMPSDWSAYSDGQRQRLTRTRCAFLHDGYDLIDPAMFAYYLDVMRLCVRHDVQPLLCVLPLTREASIEIDEQVSGRHGGAGFEALADAYRQGLHIAPQTRLFDFRTLLEDRPELFNDADHLNASGAHIFSEVLENAIAERNGKHEVSADALDTIWNAK